MTDSQVRRLADRAVDEAADALRPFGFYEPVIRSRTSRDDARWIVRLKVKPGEPVLVKSVDVQITGPGSEHAALNQLAAASLLQPGARLEHATLRPAPQRPAADRARQWLPRRETDATRADREPG